MKFFFEGPNLPLFGCLHYGEACCNLQSSPTFRNVHILNWNGFEGNQSPKHNSSSQASENRNVTSREA